MVVLFCFYIGELPKKEWEKKYVRNNVSPVVPWAHGKNPPHYGSESCDRMYFRM